MTVAISRRLNAFNQWCLRRILRIPYTAHVTNEEVRRRTRQSPVTSTICSDISHELIHPKIIPVPFRQPSTVFQPTGAAGGRPRRTWLRTIELDLQPTNLGLNSAWLRAQDRSKWRSVVETAMLTAERAT